jgi:hypothetical protein
MSGSIDILILVLTGIIILDELVKRRPMSLIYVPVLVWLVTGIIAERWV